MNQVFFVSYDLVNPGQNYEALIRAIKASPKWARLGGSAYLVGSPLTPTDLRNQLKVHLDKNDKLYVGVSPAPSAWFGLPDDVAKWIHENQR